MSQIIRQTLAALLLRIASELRPPEQIPTAEWGQKYFYLPEEGAALAGRYNLDYAPYLYGIFEALDDPEIPEVVVVKAAQVGWTFGLIVYLGRRIDTDPCPIVMLFPADEAAREFVDEKLKPSVLASPRLAAKMDVSTSRSSGNRALFKKFPGGFLKLGGSGSIHKVKSTPAKLVIVEEPDDAKDNLREQGDAITLLWERTKRYPNAKRLLGGTPSIKDLSRVEEHAKQSDKRILPIACHECGDAHPLDFVNVSWLDADDGSDHPVYGKAMPETAVYACPACGSPWDDYQRKQNIRDTVSAAREAGDRWGGWVATAPFNGSAGFVELNELYSGLPGAGLAELVKDYLKAEHLAAQGDETDKIVFTNSKLARAYEFKGDGMTEEVLREKAEPYTELRCPRDGLMITVGVDLQHDRIAVVIRAWGPGEESWLLYWGELAAAESVADKNDPVWEELDRLVFSGFDHERGGKLHASAASLDTSDGNTSDAAYHWVRTRAKKYPAVLVMGIKGSSDKSDPEIFSTPRAKSIDHVNPKKQTKADRWGVKVYMVGTNKAKDWIHSHLGLSGSGPGRFHVYENVRADYFAQVTAEVKAPHKRLRGRKVWQLKSGHRNEGLDCEVYALHAARARRVHLMTPDKWAALEQQIIQVDLFAAPAVNDASQETKRLSMAELAKRLNGSDDE